jgi:ribosomal-protein-alanine N-acetyltransferase
MPPTSFHVRAAALSDRDRAEELLRSSRWRHQHLDWEYALDLLDRDPFLLAIAGGALVGCLACPEAPPGVAWIRLFAAHPTSALGDVWEALWPSALARLEPTAPKFAALTQQAWLKDVLQQSGFRETHSVLFMEWQGEVPAALPLEGIRLRPLKVNDLGDVGSIDSQSFAPLWQHSRKALDAALAQSSLATAATDMDSTMVGYALSTFSALGGHVARLAVLPSHQHQGIGRRLMIDTLRQLHERGVQTVSVNTQSDNLRARDLYRKLGFRETGQVYPVFERPGQSANPR